MDRYICIHGHFYQPPRENPWLEAVERQDSAYPYHDWNERIAAECYAPNAASRILSDEQRIVAITNNYARISFNFGPTLLDWMEHNDPYTYAGILQADRESTERFGGHGSALAQGFGHTVLPLSNDRDLRTQVHWGVRDFEHRFGRRPEGMWLPETAVDLRTLEAVAAEGIQFTVLAPRQAARVRPLGSGKDQWQDVSGSRIDPTRAYLQRLPSGREIALFFYDGPVSQAVAFEELLTSGERFANRLVSAFSADRDWPQLVHIATDGESYGHHHRNGDMALAYTLKYIEDEGLARLTNYGEYLERVPPRYEVEIIPNTSWSCEHGVERWRSDCGCHTGGQPGWTQAWRAPLRAALDYLRDTVEPLFRREAAPLFREPWEARDAYIEVMLDRSPEHVDRWLDRHASHPLTPGERVRALKLLETQRYAMYMYTSCGWFFSELSGIETTQVIQYAGRLVQLAEQVFGEDVEPGFLARLEAAPSNLPQWGDGRRIYESCVRPSRLDLADVGAHFAIASLFEPTSDRAQVYAYRVDRRDAETLEAGRSKLSVGRARVTSEITREEADLTYGVLHFGDHNVNGGVRPTDGAADEALAEQLKRAFARADFPAVLRILDRHFGEETYSLASLFRDAQQRVLNRIMGTALAEAEAAYRQIYENRAPLMRFVANMQGPPPRAFQVAAEFYLNTELRRAWEAEPPNLDRIRTLLAEARASAVPLDLAGLGYAASNALENLAEGLPNGDVVGITLLDTAVGIVRDSPFEIDFWGVQNAFYHALESTLPTVQARAQAGDPAGREWVTRFRALGEKLQIEIAAERILA